MISDMSLWLKLLLAMAFAAAVSFMMTPPVKRFAEKVGAIDIPKDERRVHDHPIPRMGGLAIFIGFVLSLLIFVDVSTPVLGILLGALIIVVMGAIDDIVNLNAWVKLAGQIVAAVVAIRCGIVFDAISNPNAFSEQTTIVLANYLPVPLTLLWIVGCTNAVNLIDGLDGLATSTSIVCLCFFAVLMAMHVYRGYLSGEVLNADNEYALIQLVLCAVGALSGFLLFNCFPAKIFMGDTGSLALGGLIASVCVFTEYSLFVPFFGIMFVVSVVSVILQVFSFKVFKRRIFRMAPFHHHLQEKGIAENRVVQIYVAVSVAVSLLLMALTYLR